MLYNAAKTAVESLTESYADLLAPLVIRVMIIEPRGFRAGFPGNASIADKGVSEDYSDRIKVC
jgi:NAD(P)-dependent dehydrogenase (short-subunit alcohol dehydrogenase family)